MRGRRRLVFLASFYRVREGNTRRGEDAPSLFLSFCARVLEISPFALKKKKETVTQCTLQNTHKDSTVTAGEIYFSREDLFHG